jgi:predicted Ser/Thr protein kinase
MLFRFTCSSCNREIEADASLSGSQLACPHCQGPLAVPEAKVGPGVTLTGFRLDRLLGKGGMGEVYLGTQLSVERQVAVKVLPPGFAEDAHAVERFLHEGRLAARLDHGNIVTVYEAGEDNGHYYLAMAFVDGESLDRRLKRSGPLNEGDALGIVRSMADALRYAWDSFQLLHRDIKPSNIMVDERGRVFLMDLGLAKSLAEESGFTLSGTILGTPHYMSPEQALGSSHLTVGTDIYSLGATLYHLVVGSPPFTAESALQVLNKHVHEPLPSPRERNPQISEGCDRLIHVMMAKKVEDRYPDWGGLIRDIDHVLAGGLPEAAVPGAGDSMVRSSSVSAGAPSARQAHDRAALARQAQEVLARQHQAQVKSKAKPSAPATGDQPGRRRKMLIIGVAAAAALVLLGVIGVVLSRSGGHKVAGITSAGAEAPAVKTPGDQTDRTDGKSGTNEENGKNGKNGAEKARVTASGAGQPATPPPQPPKTPEAVTKTTQRPPWDRITLPHTGNWALEFDGEDDYVDIPTLKYDGSPPITIEAVVRSPGRLEDLEMRTVASNRSENGGIALDLRQPANMETYWCLSARRLPGGVKGGVKAVRAEPAPILVRTVHVAGVWNGRDLRIFINGKAASEQVAHDRIGTSDASMVVGWAAEYPHLRTSFRGTMQALRISRNARYTGDFNLEKTLPFKTDADTLCLLDFEEGEGDIAKDTSGNGHDGQIHGATWHRIWPCPVPEERLREVEDALRTANPEAQDLRLWVDGRPEGIRLILSGNPGLRDIRPLEGLPIAELHLENTGVSDLSSLRGMRLVSLLLGKTGVSDLSPLRGMPLVMLAIDAIPLRDLSPISECPLAVFVANVSNIDDLSPLSNCPLRVLYLVGSKSIRSIPSFRSRTLELVNIAETSVEDLSFLDGHSGLRVVAVSEGFAVNSRPPRMARDAKIIVYKGWYQVRALYGEIVNDALYGAFAPMFSEARGLGPYARVAALLLDGAFAEAGSACQSYASKAGQQGAVAQSGMLSTVCALPHNVLASFRTDIGKMVGVQLAKGNITCEIREVNGDAIKVFEVVKRGNTAGKIGRTIRYEDLSIQEKLRRLGSGDSPELNIMRGLLAAEAERPDIARRLFEKAGGPLGDALVAELDRRDAEAAENAADRATPASPQPGDDWTVPDLGMEFVWIKALNLWVGKYEVTNAEYRALKPDHDSGEIGGGNRFDGDRQPVGSTTFLDAVNYAAWLTGRERELGRLSENLRYRLPTEEEFMAYAQCGDGRTYPWGNKWPPPPGQAGNYGYNDGQPEICNVEQSWANPWGLYGVGGNVWEVCAADTATRQSFGAWRGAAYSNIKQEHLRCDCRGTSDGSVRARNVGFRLVLCSR